jgi:hypothetical protein
MRNVLVLKHYQLLEPTGWNDDHTESVPDWEWEEYQARYQTLRHYCEQSARKNITGLDDIIVHDSPVKDIQAAFKQHFFDLYDVWKQGNTNILYADLDVLFVRPFDWFKASEGFVMYSTGNSGVRYHGHDMDPELWDLAFERVRTWPTTKWDYEQDIYAEMAYAYDNFSSSERDQAYWKLVLQHPDHDLKPQQILANPDIKAVHFHSTRDPQQVVKHMKKTWKWVVKTAWQ